MDYTYYTTDFCKIDVDYPAISMSWAEANDIIGHQFDGKPEDKGAIIAAARKWSDVANWINCDVLIGIDEESLTLYTDQGPAVTVILFDEGRWKHYTTISWNIAAEIAHERYGWWTKDEQLHIFLGYESEAKELIDERRS